MHSSSSKKSLSLSNLELNVSAHATRGTAAGRGRSDPPAPRHLHHGLAEQTGAQGRGAEEDQRRDQRPAAAAGGGRELESFVIMCTEESLALQSDCYPFRISRKK